MLSLPKHSCDRFWKSRVVPFPQPDRVETLRRVADLTFFSTRWVGEALDPGLAVAGGILARWGACLAVSTPLLRGSGRHRSDQPRDSDEGDRPPQIVGERGQAELAADLLQPAHEKCALVPSIA